MAIFAEVINKGSFRAAARALSLSPSVVSYHITQLEKRIGAALIYRSTRHLSLTNEGELFYRSVSAMMDAAKVGIEQIEGVKTEPSGELSLSLPSALCHSPINQKISAFAKLHKNVILNVNFSDTRENIIEKGIDLAIRAGELEDSNLKAKKVGQINRRLVCTPEFYQSHKEPKSLNDINNWCWIKLEQLPSFRRFTSQKNGKLHTVDIEFNHQIRVNNVEAMSFYCLQGLGLASLADYQANPLINSGELVHVLENWQIEPISLYATWAPNVSETSLTKRLVEYLTL